MKQNSSKDGILKRVTLSIVHIHSSHFIREFA